MASLLKQIGWHEWLCHSNFSFLWGASHPAELVETAIAHGYRSLTITDFDGVYGVARTYRARRDRMKKGLPGQLKLHYGAEIHFQQDHHEPLYYQDTLALVARTARGYTNLCRILSYAHRGGKKDAFVSLEDLLNHDVTDIVAIQPMRGLLRRGNEEMVRERWQILAAHFHKHFYIAVSRHLHPAEDGWIGNALALAHTLRLPVVFAQDAFFHHPQQKDLSDLLHAIRLNCTLDEAVPHVFVNQHRTLHSYSSLERMYGEFSCFGTALRHGATLAESINFDLHELRYQYPHNMLPVGFTAQSYLEHLSWQAAKKRYGEPLPEKIHHLLRHELELVGDLGFADYFLTVWDIVRWARQQNILCQGRGSAANSSICYVLGITAVDPECFELLFERFMSRERGDPPDIDVDFEHERREEVIQYIYQRYGREQAAMVANVITFKSRGAIRSTGKALGMPDIFLDQAAQVLDSRGYRRGGAHEVIATVREDMEEASTMIPEHRWQLWGSLAERLRGFPRHLGIHSGGFMIADKPIDGLVPREPATMPGRTVIQWCKEDIEDLGFFKIDVLCLGMLTAIRKCLDLIHVHYQRPLTLASIPADDRSTYAMIQKADTVGVFQIESRAQMSMLPRLKPKCFYDLVVEVAIIRPGPIQGGMIHPYLRRRFGLEPISYPDERLKPILARTFGVPIFQEQVMRVAIEVGGFTPGEANDLRKNIGSFSMVGDVESWIPKMEAGMRKNGIAEPFVQSLIQQIRGFSEYGFPESHAASFALLAYASSYLKCHYPAAFFAAVLNSQPMGFYAPDSLIKTAQRGGVKVLPICVNHSDWDHQLEAVGTKDTGETEWGMRLGMRLVHGLSEKGARQLVEKRRVWERLLDCLMQCRLSRVDLTALAAANAFSVFGLDRRAALWLAEAAPYCDFLEDDLRGSSFAAESELEAVQTDYHATGTSLREHPTALMKRHAWCFSTPLARLTRAKQLERLLPHSMVFVFGMVLVRQAPPTAKGMMFITMEDEEGMINLVIRPHIYERFHRLLDSQAFICVYGKLEKNGDAMNIMVRAVLAPEVNQADVIPFVAAERPQTWIGEELAKSRNYM